MSYTFDFGDGSYVLTTCPNATHVYTRVGEFHVKVSARTNESGPIMASTWVFIQSSTGQLSLDYPKEILVAGNETEIVLSVSQGTRMEARLMTTQQSDKSRKWFNISGKTRSANVWYSGEEGRGWGGGEREFCFKLKLTTCAQLATQQIPVLQVAEVAAICCAMLTRVLLFATNFSNLQHWYLLRGKLSTRW